MNCSGILLVKWNANLKVESYIPTFVGFFGLKLTSRPYIQFAFWCLECSRGSFDTLKQQWLARKSAKPGTLRLFKRRSSLAAQVQCLVHQTPDTSLIQKFGTPDTRLACNWQMEKEAENRKTEVGEKRQMARWGLTVLPPLCATSVRHCVPLVFATVCHCSATTVCYSVCDCVRLCATTVCDTSDASRNWPPAGPPVPLHHLAGICETETE